MVGLHGRKVIFAWVLVAGWMVVIFAFSAQTSTQSSQLSGGILGWLLQKLGLQESPDMLGLLHELIRSLAHGLIFFVLGWLTRRAFATMLLRPRVQMGLTLLLGLLYALSDEIHQIFVPGRACQWQDLLVDAAGIGLAIAGYHVWQKWYSRRSRFAQDPR